MYKKVVVLLDGSKLAEAALPHLEEIARSCSIPEILLVSVTEAVKGKVSGAVEVGAGQSYGSAPVPAGTFHTGLIFSGTSAQSQETTVTLGKMAKTALNYLARVSEQLEQKGLRSEINVLVGNPAEEIVSFVEEKGADLIIMASRGSSGFNRWDIGNVADKVIRATNVPVMLVKPGPGFKETKPQRKGVAT
jgi:nucleotide-binding universal stress UspA family protein